MRKYKLISALAEETAKDVVRNEEMHCWVNKGAKGIELLDKLAEYKPLAKVEELTEQNYNMIDNVLNNGAEKKGTGADQRQNFHKGEAGGEKGGHRAER